MDTTKAIRTDMVGQTFGPFERTYDWKALSVFALGSGAAYDGKTDLQYVYEKNMKMLPTFAAMPIVDAEVTKTIDWGYDYTGSLHWSFDVTFHRPMSKLEGKLRTKVLLKGLYDRGEGRGTLAQHIGDTYDDEGNLLFTCESWDCCIFDGGWGGPQAPKDIVEIPEREPDFEVCEKIAENRALIYRLSGDTHPQHVDWEYAQKVGYPKPNCHAVSTAGVACRHIINSVLDGEPERLTRFKTRITKPLFPGCTVKTQIWKWDDKSVRFRVIDAENPDIIYFNFALAEYK